MRAINLTPHEMVIFRNAGDIYPLCVLPSGQLARCEEQRFFAEPVELDGTAIPGASPAAKTIVPGVKKALGAIEGLPEPIEGTIYIVSLAVASEAWKAKRLDVYCSGDAVRDSTGRVVGCIGLGANPWYRLQYADEENEQSAFWGWVD